MSKKSKRNQHNQEVESRLLDHDSIEQRSLQISRMEGHDEITADDRDRAREELVAPNEVISEPELSGGMDPRVTAWDEAPASSGTQVAKVPLEDENSVGKDLVEKGLRGPRRNRDGSDPLEEETPADT